jgi:hypothetical protein
MIRAAIALSALPVALIVLLAACDKGTTPPDANVGGKYTVTKETVFFDSGCTNAGGGKLKKGTRFTLVQERDGCWNIKLDDEDEVYIRPDRVAPAS